MIHLGIDPGASGGIAYTIEGHPDGRVWVHKMPPTCRDILDRLWSILHWKGPDEQIHAQLENVHAMPLDGRSSLAKFMRNFGNLEMALHALEIPFSLVSPQTWCKALKLRKAKDESNTAWKNRHKALAQQLFPSVKVTHWSADALLLAEYGRMVRAGSEIVKPA